MNREGRWMRCSRKQPCPVCGKSDWCCYLSTGEVFWCMRVSGGTVCGFRRGRTHENGGTAWYPTLEPPVIAVLDPVPDVRPAKIAWSEIQAECEATLSPELLEQAASMLSVPAEILRRFSIGYSRHWRAWTFPMRDPVTEQVIGIRTRTKDGRKFALTGSRQGYFVAVKQKRQRLVYVVEGPTDAAALSGLGLEVVGRASCLHQSRELRERFRGRRVVIIADNDEVGIAGANKLSAYLEGFAAAWVIQPPDGVKDAREWIVAGAKRSDIESIAWEAIHGQQEVGQQVQRRTGGTEGVSGKDVREQG
jgi:5S rRNA maturation endonuclease (ribonuclease M5)